VREGGEGIDDDVGHHLGSRAPIDFTPGALLWSMDGGTVQPHIPLSALAPALRPGI
jgi:hypothetical protein